MHAQVTGIEPGRTRFPRYDAAALGFENYWYPVMFSRDLDRRPRALRLFGQDVMFVRDGGRAYALADRCPHRGIPLSLGKREFPGTFTCRYHGWTFDVRSGELVAALTDGPDSPICGKARVPAFPVAERAGIVWIYNGTGEPPPVERDIPRDFLDAHAVIVGRITTRPGDWRHAAENGFDAAHGKYLHRDAWQQTFALMPGSASFQVTRDAEGWISRAATKNTFSAEFPGLGVWPKPHFWRQQRARNVLAIRVPGVLRSDHVGHWKHFEWYVATNTGEHRYLQFIVKRATGLRAMLFRLYYYTWVRWLFHVQFNNQDGRMVRLMKTPPEQLFRPDISLIAWRHLCEEAAAGAGAAPLESAETVYREQEHEQFALQKGTW